jgi:hypothetical protein
MNVTVVERPEMKAAVIRIPRDGHKVREAWKEVMAQLDGFPALADRKNGLVFIPEWQWETEVVMLWVGVEVTSFDSLPEGLEQITIPAKEVRQNFHERRSRADVGNCLKISSGRMRWRAGWTGSPVRTGG